MSQNEIQKNIPTKKIVMKNVHIDKWNAVFKTPTECFWQKAEKNTSMLEKQKKSLFSKKNIIKIFSLPSNNSTPANQKFSKRTVQPFGSLSEKDWENVFFGKTNNYWRFSHGHVDCWFDNPYPKIFLTMGKKCLRSLSENDRNNENFSKHCFTQNVPLHR